MEKPEEGAQAAVDFILELNAHMEIKPDFKHLGIPRKDIEKLAKASYGTSMSSNPVQLEMDEMIEYISEIV